MPKRKNPKVSDTVKTYVHKAIQKSASLKYMDQYFGSGNEGENVSSTETIYSLMAMARSAVGSTDFGGYEDNSRTSNRCKIHRVEYNVFIHAGTGSVFANTDLPGNVVRFIIGQYSDSASTLATVPQTDVTYINDACAGKLRDARFKWLVDKQVYVYPVAPGGTATYSAGTGTHLRGFIKGSKFRHVLYGGTGATSDLKGMPYVFVVSDSAVAPSPQIKGYVRVWYSDTTE